MDLKIVYDEVDKISKEIIAGGETLNTYIDELVEAVEKLKTTWKGSDSSIYCSKLEAYLNKMKDISSVYTSISEEITKCSTKYKECDEKFAKEVKETVIL